MYIYVYARGSDLAAASAGRFCCRLPGLVLSPWTRFGLRKYAGVNLCLGPRGGYYVNFFRRVPFYHQILWTITKN